MTDAATIPHDPKLEIAWEDMLTGAQTKGFAWGWKHDPTLTLGERVSRYLWCKTMVDEARKARARLGLDLSIRHIGHLVYFGTHPDAEFEAHLARHGGES